MIPRGVAFVRLAVLWLGAVAIWGSLAAWLDGVVRPMAAPPRPDAPEVLTAIAGCAAWALLSWLLLGLTLEIALAIGRAPASATARIPGALRPRLARSLVGMAIGAAVVGGSAGAGALPAEPTAAVSAVDAVASPAWRPGPPVVRPQPIALGPGWAAADLSGTHVVVRGDSLWSIAAAHLGPGAGDDEVAAEWPRWYAVNRDLIGPDPDLILPGQVLTAPTTRGRS